MQPAQSGIGSFQSDVAFHLPLDRKIPLADVGVTRVLERRTRATAEKKFLKRGAACRRVSAGARGSAAGHRREEVSETRGCVQEGQSARSDTDHSSYSAASHCC